MYQHFATIDRNTDFLAVVKRLSDSGLDSLTSVVKFTGLPSRREEKYIVE